MRFIGLFAAVMPVALATRAGAQMPATPVLQNAWTNAGVTAAVDYGHAKGENAWAAALAWSPSQARFQVSLGGGTISDSATSRGGYGARIAVPLVQFAGGSIGTGVFAGVGYSARAGARESNFPLGVALGYRRPLGATRGISMYVAPFYSLTRWKNDSTAVKHGLFRASAGVDITLAPQLGLTIGYEGGAHATGADPGPRGGVVGVALSYALRRQR
ncbi:MAG TPA: hypothetical protein VHM30_02230 [Gemmatimonadaceae bacterium]|nr:hypothetical protein [Gemmatimonadaceae bacterium]